MADNVAASGVISVNIQVEEKAGTASEADGGAKPGRGRFVPPTETPADKQSRVAAFAALRKWLPIIGGGAGIGYLVKQSRVISAITGGTMSIFGAMLDLVLLPLVPILSRVLMVLAKVMPSLATTSVKAFDLIEGRIKSFAESGKKYGPTPGIPTKLQEVEVSPQKYFFMSEEEMKKIEQMTRQEQSRLRLEAAGGITAKAAPARPEVIKQMAEYLEYWYGPKWKDFYFRQTGKTWDSAWGDITSKKQLGSQFISQSGMYYLHRGESVKMAGGGSRSSIMINNVFNISNSPTGLMSTEQIIAAAKRDISNSLNDNVKSRMFI